MTTNVVLALFIYALTCAIAIAAAVLALQGPGYRRLAVMFAVVGILVSGMGLTGWAPFGPFPDFGWSLSNGPFNISIRSQWLFILPLVSSAFASLVMVRKSRNYANEA